MGIATPGPGTLFPDTSNPQTQRGTPGKQTGILGAERQGRLVLQPPQNPPATRTRHRACCVGAGRGAHPVGHAPGARWRGASRRLEDQPAPPSRSVRIPTRGKRQNTPVPQSPPFPGWTNRSARFPTSLKARAPHSPKVLLLCPPGYTRRRPRQSYSEPDACPPSQPPEKPARRLDIWTGWGLISNCSPNTNTPNASNTSQHHRFP